MKSPFPRFAFVFSWLALTVGCAQSSTEALGIDAPPTVSGFELNRYLGTWYEIGSYPQVFQEGCVGTTATYSEREDGNVNVLNECAQNGEDIEARGEAIGVDVENGQFGVSFFWPFYGDYWIMELGEADGPDEDYTHALVGEPGRDSLWILSRTKTLDDATMDAVKQTIEDLQFDFDRLQMTEQP